MICHQHQQHYHLQQQQQQQQQITVATTIIIIPRANATEAQKKIPKQQNYRQTEGRPVNTDIFTTSPSSPSSSSSSSSPSSSSSSILLRRVSRLCLLLFIGDRQGLCHFEAASFLMLHAHSFSFYSLIHSFIHSCIHSCIHPST